nr:MAG TPA: hypothetical protein [Caudoviricetes sp.]DAW08238.1 MAG TPA: hypothetical protein [Caudoviricetes sp.]
MLRHILTLSAHFRHFPARVVPEGSVKNDHL